MFKNTGFTKSKDKRGRKALEQVSLITIAIFFSKDTSISIRQALIKIPLKVIGHGPGGIRFPPPQPIDID